MTDLYHRTHEETSALKDLEELAAQFEDKCGEASTWKTNFEKLQIDFGERTSELESLNSQLHKAKQVGTIAIFTCETPSQIHIGKTVAVPRTSISFTKPFLRLSI